MRWVATTETEPQLSSRPNRTRSADGQDVAAAAAAASTRPAAGTAAT